MSFKKSNGLQMLVIINDSLKASLFVPKLESKGYIVKILKSFENVSEIQTPNRREIIMLTPFGLNYEDIHTSIQKIKRKNPEKIIVIYQGDYFAFIDHRERKGEFDFEFGKNLVEPPFDVEFVDYYIWSSFHPIQASLRIIISNIKNYYFPKLTEIFRKLKYKKKPMTYMDKLEQIEGIKELQNYYEFMSKNGTTEDIHPKGIGQFGYEETNPVPTNNIFGSRAYLNRLRDKNGNPIEYERLGSIEVNNIENPIDRYKITDSNGSVLGIIYISPYQQTISKKAPDGFLMS